MKPNVDLSEGRMFTNLENPEVPSTSVSPLEILSFLNSVGLPKEPWKYYVSMTDSDFLLFSSHQLFMTGNKHLRKRKKANYLYENEQICSFCGQHIGKKPWVIHSCKRKPLTTPHEFPWNF